MTVRTKFSLWYIASMAACTMVVIAHAYYEIWLRDHEVSSEKRSKEIVIFTVGLALPLTLLGLGGGFYLTRSTLNELRRLTEAATQTKAENLGVILKRTNNKDEFDRLTGVFNEMRQRLNNSFQQVLEFTLSASHELKTPLTLMRAEVETALKRLPAGENSQRAWMEDLVDEMDRLARIVDRLTFLSKADAGLVQIKRLPIELAPLVIDATEDAQLLGSTSQISVTLSKCQPCRVLGDTGRLRQLMLNLIDNAVKHNSPNGEIDLSLQAEGDTAVIKVRNTGPGLTPEEQPRVFDRFFRGQPSVDHIVEGSGLGLVIVRWIVEAHEGTVKFESEPNQWTLLTVRLPILREESVPS